MISADISGMSNEDLAIALRKAGVRVGPITDTTRLVYERKLARLQQNVSETSSPAPAEVEEEEEEEEEEEKPLYEEKATERPYDLPTRLTRSVTRSSHRRTTGPPLDTSLDREPGQIKTKEFQKTRDEGTTKKNLSTKDDRLVRRSPSSPPVFDLVPEETKLPRISIRNQTKIKSSGKSQKDLSNSKTTSDVTYSTPSNYNSTVIYPDSHKAGSTRRSFGLSDSFHIAPKSSSPEISPKTYPFRNGMEPNVMPFKETLEPNNLDSDASESSLQGDDDAQFINGEYNDLPANDSFLEEDFPELKFVPSQRMEFSELTYNTEDPSPRRMDESPSRFPTVENPKVLPVFKKPDLPPSRIGRPKSLVEQAPSSKNPNSIWKVGPEEEENIRRGFTQIKTGSSTNSSLKYDYLPKAFVEKYGRFMNKASNVNGSQSSKKRQSVDSLLFQTQQKPSKSSSYDSVGPRVKTNKLTSAYQRYNSPLASKITGGNNTPSYIGTPARSHLNTSLTRRPLREETRFTSLRNSETSSASASASSKKKDGGISLMVKLFFLIILGLIVWLIYMNFESAATKPLLTTNH